LNQRYKMPLDDADEWGIWSRYNDGLGRDIAVNADIVTKIRAAVAASDASCIFQHRRTLVLRHGESCVDPFVAHGGTTVFDICDRDQIVASATIADGVLKFSDDLPIGIYQLRSQGPQGEAGAQALMNLVVAPGRAYQGPPNEPLRSWLIGVQLYGIRSHTNWGHGDFTDLAVLLECAAECGAGGIGLNPLHALFDDRPDHVSPYSPNSRRFLDPLYIDVQRIDEFPGIAVLQLQAEVVRLRASEHVDYPGVRAAKFKALRACHAAFRANAGVARRQEFEKFRAGGEDSLRRFACFETLRRRFKEPWWLWPPQWRTPSEADIEALRAVSSEEVEFHEYVQWIADRQLAACREKARQLGLPIGLYLDLAVGVVPDGADAWCNHGAMLRGVSIGAPADEFNRSGQNWGLTTFNPVGLSANRFEPYRLMLSAAMRYAGAIRIDHVLGLNRLFVVPDGSPATEGTYIDCPFEPLLAIVAEQSERHRCVVIGEDLGTVPDDFRSQLTEWGLWSYRVMQFERDGGGRFYPPSHYDERALATFATHDLATFAGWWSGQDIKVRTEIGLDSGESEAGRTAARSALRQALEQQHGYREGDFTCVARFLADTPSRLVAVSLEDILGTVDQPNIPGSIDEYANWKKRSQVTIENLPKHPRLKDIAAAMRDAGRSSPPVL
jgi:4-alpha-glucanotransferase